MELRSKKYFDKKFCCKMMSLFVSDERVLVDYYSTMREYSIYLRGFTGVQQMHFCPWCGVKFPKGLRDEYLEILEKKYGIDDPWDEEQKDKVPKEFETDEWWRKRGL